MTADNDQSLDRFPKPVCTAVHLIVPIKPLHLAKSRLVGTRPPAKHADLVAAMALDTVGAARRAPGVADVVVVTSDPMLTAAFAAEGVEVLADLPTGGLNAALRHGGAQLRQRGSVSRIGALQADLPALRPAELGAAISAAGDDRSCCPDRHGTGTTLLLAEPGRPLDPRFGPDSAEAHAETGAKTLLGPWDSLRCDVDTEADLAAAITLGVGPRTTSRVGSA
ncbi:2-phospho-L-lactate guanylyltransferase [Saccharopolyspora sp. 5N708]|uniref:2-phospho-L-lactate guanylyltransferase n=1 Tax=Saccharopolyspora sp. 5N708 TaxID=3457424 RepID=UPI003FD61DB4